MKVDLTVKPADRDRSKPKWNSHKWPQIVLHPSGRWHGANQYQAKRIYDQHLKVSWAHVMCGSWNKAIELLDRGNRR